MPRLREWLFLALRFWVPLGPSSWSPAPVFYLPLRPRIVSLSRCRKLVLVPGNRFDFESRCAR
jgi:hypothetical protein